MASRNVSLLVIAPLLLQVGLGYGRAHCRDAPRVGARAFSFSEQLPSRSVVADDLKACAVSSSKRSPGAMPRARRVALLSAPAIPRRHGRERVRDLATRAGPFRPPERFASRGMVWIVRNS